MSRNLLFAVLAPTFVFSQAMADVPRVAVDVAPIHSLVARVMEGVGEPTLIVQSGASPHEYSLRPSEAEALQNAELVFWVGEELTPWMHDAIETLADTAVVTTLLKTDGTILLEFREDAMFEAHDHEEHAKSDGDDHGHENHHDGHDDHEDHEEHDHERHDPHAWLSPGNADTWLNIIAAQLSASDPENAGTYFVNAAAGQEEISVMVTDIAAILDPVRGNSFVVFHDAYHYFETAFDFPASGAVSLSDASDPSPARIAKIQERVRSEEIECVLAEPQFNASLVATIMDGTKAVTGVLDPLGSKLELGADMYPQLMMSMARALADCLE